MSSLNRIESKQASNKTVNHNGLVVKKASKNEQLVRMTMAHMLWEDSFYIDGKSAAQELEALAKSVDPAFVMEVAAKARSDFKLRHVPLLLARAVAATGKLKAEDLASIIQRPDELGEFLAIYNKDKKQPLSNQVKKGLAMAFSKFNEYSLAKWDKNSAAYSLRDVMFLTHPKPANAEQEALFKKIANNELEVPDTWETQLSAGADKKETFTRLLVENKLGALAFIRNLRNMLEAGVSQELIKTYSRTVSLERVLPFRFITAIKHAPAMKQELESMMFRCLEGSEKLVGRTVMLVDVSGSMFETNQSSMVGRNKEMRRFDAAAALAILCRELSGNVDIFTFSSSAVRVPDNARGFRLAEALEQSQSHGGTNLQRAVKNVNMAMSGVNYDRMIVFTDEQSSTRPEHPGVPAYILNVGHYANGLNMDDWITISGFSEASLKYIQTLEQYKL